jgi:hypothetical protein
MSTPDRYIVDLAGTKKPTFKVGESFALLTSRNLNTTAGELTGGGDLSADRTFGLADTTVSAGTYGSAAVVPEIIVDAKGRLISVINRTITPGGIGASALGHTHVPADITGFYAYGITGTKSLTGGGTLAADRTMELVNDLASPGNTQYYGTNGSGTKGWFSLLGQNLIGLETTGITGLLTLTKSGTNPRTLTAPDASGTIRLVEDIYACLALNTSVGAPAYGEGKLYWDSNDHTLALMTEINGVTIQVGQEEVTLVKNQTGSTVTNGQVVYVNGANSSRPTIALALATSILSNKVIGICTYDIAHNAIGYVCRGGLVRNLNTFSWTVGDELFVSDSVAGALTNIAPTAPNHAVRVGYVLSSHLTDGIIMVHVDVGNSLNDLHDVYLDTVADKNALRYVAANTRWENTNKGAWIDTAQSFTALQTFSSGAIVSDLTSTYMVVSGASGRLANSAIIQGSITGAMTFTKSGTTARAINFPDAAITVSGSAVALTSGRVPYVTTGGLLTDSANFAFTTASGLLAIGSNAQAFQSRIDLNSAAGYNRGLLLQTGGASRWFLFADTATESGSDAGSTFTLRAYTDAGASIDSPLTIIRAAGGAITLARPVTCSSTLSCTSITASGLIPGRVPYVTTGGLLTDSAALTFGATTLFLGTNAGASTTVLAIIAAAGQYRGLQLQTASVNRWTIYANATAEGGADAGSNFEINARNDAGSAIDTPLSIVRAAGGAITLARPVACSSTLSAASLTASGLTSGRVPYVTTGGLLTDSAQLLFNGSSTFTVGDGSLASCVFAINGTGASNSAQIALQAASVTRWNIRTVGATSSGDAGANLEFVARTDAGAGIDTPFSIVRAAGGAITLARPVTCTGAVTVPNGTAAAPGIRLTGAQHGFYYYAATALAMSVAGAQSAVFYAPNGSSFGTGIMVTNPSAAEPGGIIASIDTGNLQFGGWQGNVNVGGQLRAYGSTHATKASYVEFTRGATISAYFDGSGNLTCTGVVTVPNGTAGAPGIRLTSNAHGLYRASSTSLGFAVAGVAAASLTSAGAFAAVGTGSFGTTIALGTSFQVGAFAPNSNYGPAIAAVADSGGRLFYGYSANWVNGVSGSIAAWNTSATGVSLAVSVSGGATAGTLTLTSTTEASALGTAAEVNLGGLSVAKNIVGGQALNLGIFAAAQLQSTAGRILLSSSATDVTSKATFLLNAHYTNAEEAFGTILASSNNGTNLLMLGGGSASYNAATSVSIYTGATSTTVTGTARLTVDSAGLVTIPGDLTVTGSSTFGAVYAGRVEISRPETTGAVLYNHWINSASDVMRLIFTETAVGAIPQDVWQYRFGGSSARPIVWTNFDTDIIFRLDPAGVVTMPGTIDATTTSDGTLRVSGGISCAKAFVSTASSAGAHYWGPAGTDGSVRVYGNAAGALVVEKRASGSWTEIGRFA